MSARRRANGGSGAPESLRLDRIHKALVEASAADLAAAAEKLLGALGYRSERRPPEQSGCVDDFIANFGASGSSDAPPTRAEREFRQQARAVHLLFQLTNDEIAAAAPGQAMLFETNEFDPGDIQSFMFAAVDLCGQKYPRGAYARFTREINKRLVAPTVVVFRTADSSGDSDGDGDSSGDNSSNGDSSSGGGVSLAFVHRRPHKRDQNRDVLGSVSLIREIDPADPHRAHLDILRDLALDRRLAWMEQHRPRNGHGFQSLLDAWLAALDTQELNASFYRDLEDWFDRAVAAAVFPGGQPGAPSNEEHVIRLVTRLLFVWFMREKRLVDPGLFVEAQIGPLLRDYRRQDSGVYYRAVLQNLFFATLNTQIGQRRFSRQTNATHRNFSCYRYKKDMRDSKALLDLFARTPFVNGGLFDCLDSEASTKGGGMRVDGFSDNPKQRGGLSVPNTLFFASNARSGLIDIFQRYKFTVEENTPAEQEVALDPELMGRVFESLLAKITPETRQTVRRQTGSYYTPRPVVDYMVDEALVEALAQKTPPDDGDGGFWRERLRYLLDYHDAFDDALELFTAPETEGLVRAIAGLKILDPAVGSGAFPMGALHKLTLALRRLDPRNRRWETLQKELARQRAGAAFDTADQKARDAELQEISATFQRYRDSDFGRKLYLIQNSIYGVDIQPTACQIAKLRFFISLAIEQEPTDAPANNYGIEPLPNLETRFVAADTLLALDKPDQKTLESPKVRQLRSKLADNRERHFHARTRPTKLKCSSRDQDLRQHLAKALQSDGLAAASAGQLAAWDPFDQNANAADWFDAEHMFDVRGGFDVVIGNPPYVQLQKESGRLGRRYQNAGFTTFVRTGDVYQLFLEKGGDLLASRRGVLAFVTSNSWLKAEYGKRTRRWLANRCAPLRLLELGKDVFANAIVDTCVLVARQGASTAAAKAVDVERLPDGQFPPPDDRWGELRLDGDRPWSALSALERSVMDKMEAAGTPLTSWDVSIYRGVTTGLNAAFIIDDAIRQSLVLEDPKSADIIKPALRGRDIRRYRANWAQMWIIDSHNGYGDVPAIDIDEYPAVKSWLDRHYDYLAKRWDKGKTPYNLRSCAYHQDFAKEKLLWIELVNTGRFAYDNSGLYPEATAFILIGESVKYLCALLNSTLIRWFLYQSAPTSGMGTLRWKKVYVETIPVPKIPAARQRPFIRLVDRILQAKAHDPHADTSAEESKIDHLVYQLYDLTNAEIAAIQTHHP